MEYYELTVTVVLNKQIEFSESYEIIGKNINAAMLLDKQLADKHKKNRYKFYVYKSFSPIEKNKFYMKGRVYVFTIRSLDIDFIRAIKKCLNKLQSSDFKVISSELKIIYRKHITELYTITPVVITVEKNKNWILGYDFSLIEKRLNMNLEKKYKSFYNEKFTGEHSFIQGIEILNKKVISMRYKNSKMLGNKFRIMVKRDERSQKLAFVAEAVGLGEKNSSIGAGFCNAQYLK